MAKESQNSEPQSCSTSNNKNTVKVNNNFNLTINLGDSLNLIALIAGIYVIRRIAKNRKQKQQQEKM